MQAEEMSSAALELIPDGAVIPLTFMVPARPGQPGRYDGSVHFEDGRISELARINKAAHSFEPKPFDPSSLAHVEGKHVFGGMLQNEHFGHFVAENLARLWAFDHLDRTYNSVVFYLRSPKIAVASFVQDMFNLLLPEIDVHFVRIPTKFDFLAVPQELTDRGCIVGKPLIKNMCRKLVPVSVFGPKRVYMSRSKLNRGAGGILGDSLLDKYLSDEGYTVLFPESMTISEQLAAYSSAEKLIFAEGSALHLYALVSKPDQQVFVIWRRGRYEIFDRQIQSFGGKPVQGAPCITRLWVPEQEAPDAAHGQAILNFADLNTQLRQAGFIQAESWYQPPDAELEQDLWQFATIRERNYVLKPLKNPN